MPTKRVRRTKAQIRRQASITDGCNSELVEGAEFDGLFEIPIIKKPDKIMIPKAIVPFSKMDKVEPDKYVVCEYENDKEFSDIFTNPEKYVKQFREYQAFITPDASMYWDMPFAAQVVNKYRNHVIGYYMQKKGIYVIPNVRWGDERTYTTKYFPERLAFLGVEKHSIVSIGTYGAVKQLDEKKHFKAGLEEMLKTLEPEVVLVYGSMPEDIFGDYDTVTKFIRYQDWTSLVRKDNEGD